MFIKVISLMQVTSLTEMSGTVVAAVSDNDNEESNI